MVKKKEEKIDIRYNLKVYFSFLKPYRFLFISLVILLGLFEVVRLISLLMFKAIVDNGALYAAGSITREALIGILLSLAAAYGIIIIVRTVTKWFQSRWLVQLDANLIVALKRYFYKHLLSLSHNFHTTHKTGSLISRLARGGHGIEAMTDFLIFNLVPVVIQVVIAGLSLAYFDVTSAVILLAVSVVFIWYSVAIQQRQKPASAAANTASDRESGMISDTFTNIDSIKYYGKEATVSQRYAAISEITKKKQITHWNYFSWLDAGQIAILSIGVFAVLYFPILAFINGEISLGTLTFIEATFGVIMDQLFYFTYGIRNFYRAMADFQDLFKYKKVSNDIKDVPGAVPLVISTGAIAFSNVSFRYHNRKIVHNFNLSIPPNTRVAFVGPSGSGKSTLIKLLYRLYDVEKGEITIDGRNIRDFKQESLRGELSIVPQECILFDDTIYNNILFSRPDASKSEVMQAIKAAQLDKTIAHLPQKENTIVGERGVKLSGGEKQRVSIARALLANKKVLVLDEATSALDSETEHEIQQSLNTLMKNRTSLIIAHRLSTIMHADLIVVLDKGSIVQQGTHIELVRKRGLYRELWNLQRGGYFADDEHL